MIRIIKINVGAFVLVAFVIAAGALLAVNSFGSQDAEFPYLEVAPGAIVPKLTLHKVIKLENGAFAIADMRFSPDNKFLAIGYSRSMSERGVKVWNLELDREQSNFSCRAPDNSCIGSPAHNHILWSRDSREITFGTGPRWNALTGASMMPDEIKDQYAGRLDRAGTRILVFDREAFSNPDFVTIYDIRSRTSQKLYVGDFEITGAIWTSEDKILLALQSMRENKGKTRDGFVFENYGDSGFQLIDPESAKPIRSIWFRGVPAGDQSPGQFLPSFEMRIYENSLDSGMVALATPYLLNDRTLEIKRYFSDETMASLPGYPSAGGMAFTPDGRYLFLKDIGSIKRETFPVNTIIDTVNLSPVAKFGSGPGFHSIGISQGIAVSPDGSKLALGDVYSVQIMSMGSVSAAN